MSESRHPFCPYCGAAFGNEPAYEKHLSPGASCIPQFRFAELGMTQTSSGWHLVAATKPVRKRPKKRGWDAPCQN